jgi:hypothetical protein
VALVTESSMVIAWRTVEPALGAIEYGVEPDLESRLEGAAPARVHVFHLEGLAPGTRYSYRVLVNENVMSEGHMPATQPGGERAPFRFAALADLGSGTPQMRVAAALLAAAPDLAILPGDIAYESGTAREVESRYFGPYAHLIDHIPFFPVLGNHDIGTAGGRPLLDALHLPENDANGSEAFYSFDWGNVHFVGLNSNADLRPGSVQGRWLDGDLARATADWTVVYFHHPLFSSALHGSSLELRSQLEPLLDRHRVDLVFSGHDHVYERTYPIIAARVVDSTSEPDYVDPGGTIYIVTGGGGRSLYPSGQSSFTAFSRSVHHFTRVDVDGLQVTVTAVQTDGSVLDRMTIRKTALP